MRRLGLLTAAFTLAVGLAVAFGATPGAAQPQPRAHVYLLRGLFNVFSLGMDSLTEELKRRGVDATVHGYGEWQTLADRAAADYKAGKEGPIILIGHSLGADAVMEMAADAAGLCLYARRTWFPRHPRQCRCQFRFEYRPHQYR
jgi:hypothetical protein